MDLDAAGKFPGHRHASAMTTSRGAELGPPVVSRPLGTADEFEGRLRGVDRGTFKNGDGSDPCPWSQGCGAVVVP